MPPPAPPTAWLPDTVLLVSVSVPPFAIPPAPPAGPPVAVLPETRLPLIAIVPPAPPLPPLPFAIPPPPWAELPLTTLLFSTAVPLWFRMPPPPPFPGVARTTLSVTRVEFRVSIPPAGPGGAPLTIPPPASAAVFPVTTQWFNVSVLLTLPIPPPTSGELPPVTVRLFNVTMWPGKILSVLPAPWASRVALGDPVTVTFAVTVNVPSHVPLTNTVPPAVNA